MYRTRSGPVDASIGAQHAALGWQIFILKCTRRVPGPIAAINSACDEQAIMMVAMTRQNDAYL